MFLTRISINHPVFATMITVMLLVFGAFSYGRLGLDEFPNIDVPVVVVTTAYPGASSETIETEVTRPVEEALNTISGLDKLTSTSYEGRSVVVAIFKLEVQSAAAAQDVREKVAALQADFPKEVKTPIVSRANPADMPILSIAISSTSLGVPELTAIADQRVLPQLTTVPGVGQATLVGGQKKQLDIGIDETRLRALGIGAAEVINSLRSSNENTPAGSIVSDVTEHTIQVQGRTSEPKDFLDIIVAQRGGGPVYLGDVATVKVGAADPESRAIYNGRKALAVDIVKIQNANTVQVVADIRKRLDRLNAALNAKDIQLQVITDTAIPIQESLGQVRSTLIEGAALAVAIVFLFLNSWRSTVITALTLPIAMVGTLAVINVLGFTLNTLSLLALTLSIGILVDDAIVVRENITRHLHMGKSHLQAAFDGTNEIGLAVTATTATIVAVFLPVAFMDGIVGRFFYEFGITVSTAVLISLFVAFTLDPMLSSIWHDPDAEPGAKRGPAGRLIARFDNGFETVVHRYRETIRCTLQHRLITVVLTGGIFTGSIFMVPLVGVEFVPTADVGRFQINVTAPVGSSLDYTSVKIGQVERALHEFPEVASVYSMINTGNATGKHKAAVLVTLQPADQRNRTPVMLADPVRERLAAIPGIQISIVQEGLGGGSSPIQLNVLGDDSAVLETIAKDLMTGMRRIPGMVDINSSANEPKQILSVRLKREQASDLGIGISDLTGMLSTLIGGEVVSTWTHATGETYDIVARLQHDQRARAATIGELMIPIPARDANGNPRMIRLDQVADVAIVETASEIRRMGMSREVLVSADISNRAAGDVITELEALIAGQKLPAGYQIAFGGSAEEIDEMTRNLLAALIMAVLLIYAVLASQFASFTQPVAIMAALPLSLIGVLIGLLFAGSTINMFSMIGFIMLMGLVTKNGILLVDFANRERQRGLSITDALVNAGAVRFRPIIMTTLAMIFGMVPLAMAAAGGGAQRAPMAYAVIGGLVSSTILTLIVVPVMLSYIDSLTRWLARKIPARNNTGNEPATTEAAK